MPKYESKRSFYQTEAKTLVIQNDNDATAVAAWLMEKSDCTREDVLSVRSELDALIYSEELDLSNEAKQALQNISSKLYNIMFGKK